MAGIMSKNLLVISLIAIGIQNLAASFDEKFNVKAKWIWLSIFLLLAVLMVIGYIKNGFYFDFSFKSLMGA